MLVVKPIEHSSSSTKSSSDHAERAVVARLWEHYRAFARTARRLKGEQVRLKRWLLAVTVVNLLLMPFAKTFERLQYPRVSLGVTAFATVSLLLLAWFKKEVLGDDSERAWVRCRQTSEALKSLTFRFLADTPKQEPPFSSMLKRAEELVAASGVVPDAAATDEAGLEPPRVPLTVEDYIAQRVDGQNEFYARALERERAASASIVRIGRAVSGAVVAFGGIAAYLDGSWRDIWTPALGAVAALATADGALAHHRFLIHTYSAAVTQLKFEKTRWEVSSKGVVDRSRLTDSVESVLAAEQADWVRRLLLDPPVPEKQPPKSR